MSNFVNTVDSLGDEALTNSIIDRSITEIQDNYVATIGNYSFSYCGNLTAVHFPAATSIGKYAFKYCTALTEVDFPAATNINAYSFGDCSALTTADFPAVTSIESYAFSYCTKLTTLILRSATVATLSELKALERTAISYGKGYIYVPAALVDSYKAATNWSTYANQIRAIEDYPDICG